MKILQFPPSSLAIALVAAGVLGVSANPAGAAGGLWSRWSAGYRVGVNMSVDYSGSVGFPSLVGAQDVTLDGDPWNYLNGYVYPDISGRSADTFYWGQTLIDPAKLPTVPSVPILPNDPALINLHAFDADPSDSDEGDLRPGLELTYSRVLGVVSSGHWGIQGSFGYTTISSSADFSNPIHIRTDQYSVPGAPAFPPGYQGVFDPVPGDPLLLLGPVSSQRTPVAEAFLAGERSFDADLYELKFGPYMEAPLTKRLSISFDAGVTVAALQSELEVRQTARISDLALVNSSVRVSGSSDDFLLGGYAGVQLWYSLTSRWTLFANAQYQYLQSGSVNAGGSKAELDLGQTVYVTIGTGWAF